MHFKKAFSLSMTNMPLVIKTIIMQLVIISLVVAVFALCVSAPFENALNLINELELKEEINIIVEDFAQFFTFNEEFDSESFNTHIMSLITKLRDVLDQAKSLFISFAWATLGLLVGLFVYRYILAFVDIPAVAHLTDFMQTANSKPYIWYFFKNFGKTLLFAFWQAFSTLWLDAIIFVGAIGLYIVFLSSLKVWGIILAFALLNFAYSARQVMFSFWLPEMMLNHNSIRKSLNVSMQKVLKVFWKVFWQVFCIIGVSTIVTLVVNYFSQDFVKLNWLSLVLTTIINLYSFLLIKCVAAVEYFELEERPYFCKRIKIQLTPETVK